MDDQRYSASALDHSQGLDDDDAHHHHATSSLFDLFDGVHAEHHSQQGITIAHTNASDPSSSSSTFVHPDILFPPNDDALSQQERGLMEDITRDPDDPDAWMWSFDDEDASRDATKKTTSNSVALSRPPAHLPHVASASSSVSPSPFAAPSRESTTRPREQETAINTADKGNHASSSRAREDNSQADPVPSTSGDIEMRAVGPDHDRHQGLVQNQPSPTSASPDVEMRADDRHEGLLQSHLGASRRSSSAHSLVPPRRTSRTPLFLPSPSESSPPPRRNSNWDPDPLDVISVTSSSDSPLPPPRRRSARKSKKQTQTPQFMSHVLVPSLPPGARSSDYAPVKERPRPRDRRASGKGKTRAGDNSGSNELMHVLQNAFESNWYGPGSTNTSPRERKKKRTKKKPAKEVVVVEDSDDEGGKEKDQANLPTSLDQALATAFTLNSANPNVSAKASTSAPVPPVASGSTRRLRRQPRAEPSSDSGSVEVVMTSPTTKRRANARAKAASNDHTPVLPRVSPRRKGKRRDIFTPVTSPRKKRRRVARASDPSGEHKQIDSDDEVEIVVDAPRRVSKAKPQPQSKYKSRRSSKQHPASTPPPAISASISVHTSSPSPSPPPSSPDVNSLAGLPLTILPAPSRTGIAVPPRALSHLQKSSSPPSDDSRTQQMQRQAIRQGFCYEESATGAHGLLANNSPAAAELTTPLADSGACATTSDSSDHGIQHAGLDLDLDVSMGLAESDADADGVTDDEVVVPSLTPPTPHPLLRSSGTHDHPDGPMLGFVAPEHDNADPDPIIAGTSLDHAHASPDRGLDFDLTSLSAISSGGEGWADWNTAPVLGGPSASTEAGLGEYAGDGTIDPSILGGAGLSPAKVDDYSSSPADRRVELARGVDEDYRMNDEEEEDVMGLLFAENTSDDDFVPPSGLGKGKGKSRAVTLDGVVDSPESVGASSSTRVQRKRRRKSFPDEAEHEHRIKQVNDSDDDQDSDEDGSRARTISAPALVRLDARPKKRRRTTTSSSSSEMTFCHHCRCKTRRPKMRCTLIVASAGERCRKLFCDGCIEKRYPDVTFDMFADTFECPCCSGYCNCSHCAPKRGEQYVPERNGGWRSWIAQQGGGTYRPAAVPPPPRGPTTTTKIKTKTRVKAAPVPVKKRPPAITIPAATTNTQVFDSSWSATAVFTVSGEPLGNAFLQGNTAHVVPVQQPTVPPPPPAPPPATSSTPELAQKQEQLQKQRHVFIGKPLESWGRLVVLPDPEPDQPEQKTTKGKGKVITRRGRKSKKTRFFVGSLDPLLAAWRQNRRRRRQSASFDATNADNPGDDVDEDANPDQGDLDADADGDTDDGVWPGEFVVPTIVITEPDAEPEVEMVGTRITPEEVERAIGAAFAIGAAAE